MRPAAARSTAPPWAAVGELYVGENTHSVLSNCVRAASARVRSTTSIILWASLVIFALALLVRWPHLSQSLWLDEMTTLVDYVRQPWSRVVAARAGEYVPNTHVLHTALP